MRLTLTLGFGMWLMTTSARAQSIQLHTTGNTVTVPVCNGANEALRFTGTAFVCGTITATGEPGPQGPAGPKGDTGDAGPAGTIPSGAILIIDSGACPAGTAEVSAMAGRTLIGTLAANLDIGTTGGSDTLTPAGSVTAPSLTMNSYTPAGTLAGVTVSAHTGANVTSVFTGTALAAHSHELPFQKVAGGTGVLRMLAPTIFGTGTSRAAESQSAAPVANTTAAAVLLSQGVSGGTPAGTIANTVTQAAAHTVGQGSFSGTPATLTGVVAAPTFAGTQADNRSAYMKVLFCRAN